MAQRKLMFNMIQDAAGKPIILADPYSLPVGLLCEASAEADVTVASPHNDEPGAPGLPERRAELERVEASCFDNDVPASLPGWDTLVVSLSQSEVETASVETRIEEIAASGATRIVLSLDHDSLSEGVLVELENYLSACARNLLPIYVSAHSYSFNLFGQNELENTLETAIDLLVGARVTGIVVNPDQVEAAKSRICELDSGAAAVTGIGACFKWRGRNEPGMCACSGELGGPDGCCIPRFD